MEVQGTESTSSSASGAISTASSDTSAGSQASASSQPVGGSHQSSQSAASVPSIDQPVVPATPAYTPNYTFKVMDKEHTIPDWLQPSIKSQEHEKQLKDIYEKAMGLDDVKASREKAREEYKAYKAQTEPFMKPVQQAARLYHGAKQAFKDGNIRGGVFKLEEAFKELGLEDQVLQQYVYQKLQAEELPNEQKADYNRQRELELQYAQMQTQMQEQQNYFQQLAVQNRTAELNQATSRPEVVSIVQSFDQRNGPGSFHQEVIARGRLYWQTQQRDVPPDQLVQEIITKYGLSAPQQAPPQAAPVSRDVPVIPTVKGSAGSPAAKQFTSTADLVEYRKKQYGY